MGRESLFSSNRYLLVLRRKELGQQRVLVLAQNSAFHKHTAASHRQAQHLGVGRVEMPQQRLARPHLLLQRPLQPRTPRNEEALENKHKTSIIKSCHLTFGGCARLRLTRGFVENAAKDSAGCRIVGVGLDLPARADKLATLVRARHARSRACQPNVLFRGARQSAPRASADSVSGEKWRENDATVRRHNLK